MVRVLREGFGVLHPLLLAGMPAAPTEDPLGSEQAHDLEPIEVEIAHPVRCEDDLADLVSRTLATLTGDDVLRDDDGDWHVATNGTVMWVRLLRGQPTIHAYAYLVRDIRSKGAATREVAILNRDAVMLRYVLDDDRLKVETEVKAGPFVPGHLIDAMNRLRYTTGQQAHDFAARTGGEA